MAAVLCNSSDTREQGRHVSSMLLAAGISGCVTLHDVACALLQDLPGALSDAEVAEGLGLPQIKNRDWSIFKTSAVKGDGLFEGEPRWRLSAPASAK